ncbi:hypothetical protein BH11PLA2_BH11PLA2_34450 [soil metagenome]
MSVFRENGERLHPAREGDFSTVEREYLCRYPKREKWYQAWELWRRLGKTQADVAGRVRVSKATASRQLRRTDRQIFELFRTY